MAAVLSQKSTFAASARVQSRRAGRKRSTQESSAASGAASDLAAQPSVTAAVEICAAMDS